MGTPPGTPGLLIVLLLILAAGLPAVLERSTSYACYCIGAPPSLEEALRHRLVIVDPDEFNSSLIPALHEHGVRVLAYLNTGYAEEWRSYWPNVSSAGIVHGETEYEGEYYVEYWSPLWTSTMTGLARSYLDMGYDGVYLDNVDAYVVLQELQPEWAQGVDLRGEMLRLIQEIRANTTGLLYVNLGGALEDLHGGASLAGIIDGALREEVLYYSTGKCTNRPASPDTAIKQLLLLAKARLLRLDILVVEFVEPGHQALTAGLTHTLLGLHPILQPACTQDYTEPPIILGNHRHAPLTHAGSIINPQPT